MPLSSAETALLLVVGLKLVKGETFSSTGAAAGGSAALLGRSQGFGEEELFCTTVRWWEIREGPEAVRRTVRSFLPSVAPDSRSSSQPLIGDQGWCWMRIQKQSINNSAAGLVSVWRAEIFLGTFLSTLWTFFDSHQWHQHHGQRRAPPIYSSISLPLINTLYEWADADGWFVPLIWSFRDSIDVIWMILRSAGKKSPYNINLIPVWNIEWWPLIRLFY